MKLLLMCAALSATMFSQSVTPAAKVAPTKEATAAPTERPLTDNETLKLQLTAAKIQLLQEKFKVSDYNKEVAPISAEQMAVVRAACLSVGVPEDKLQTSCGITTGLDGDGKPLTGADGKPIAARVWYQMPVEKK